MESSWQSQALDSPGIFVGAGNDRFGEQRGMGVSYLSFKVSATESKDIFIVEQTMHAKGGPGRHLHYDQEEWFYALEGEFRIEVGQDKFRLKPGDSVLAPRRVPHVWAYTGIASGARGRLLIVFTPPGKMESFFREVTKANAMPPQDAALFRAYGMELLGPPLALD